MKITLHTAIAFLLLVVPVRAATEPEASAILDAAAASQTYCAQTVGQAALAYGNGLTRWDALEARWQDVKANATMQQTQQYNGAMGNALYWFGIALNCYTNAANVSIAALANLQVAEGQYENGEYTACYNTCQIILTSCQYGSSLAGMCIYYCDVTADGYMDTAEAVLEQLE